MNSRERVIAALEHRQPDRVPVDLGASHQSGISASTLYKLRAALGLEQHAIPVYSLFQLLGLVEEDVRQALGIDVVGLFNPADMKNGVNNLTQPLTMCDGTPVLIGDNVAYGREEDGSWVIYPQGDRTARPGARMPANGFFFDALDRAQDFDEDNLTPLEDFKDSFPLLNEADCEYLHREAERLYNSTDCAVLGALGGCGLGDVANIPAPNEKQPRGIRRIEDWMMAHILYPEYIEEVFKLQSDVMLKNLEMYRQAVGDRIQLVWISGTDFGTQNGEFIRPELFRKLYKPYYAKVNQWVHQNTGWKTFYHSCGSIVGFLDDFVDMGVDALNPVQLSAKGMDARMLKDKYGGKLTFWGGGVDTQQTLPYGTPEEVRKQVLERLEILSRGGGYVFNFIHNVVAKTPVENLMAAFDAVREFNGR